MKSYQKVKELFKNLPKSDYMYRQQEYNKSLALI